MAAARTATGAFATSTASTKGAANDCGATAATVKINEVESNEGTPGDWVELYNTGTAAVNLGGFIFKDNDDTAQLRDPRRNIDRSRWLPPIRRSSLRLRTRLR